MIQSILLIDLFSLVFSLLSVSATNSVAYYKCSQLCFSPMTRYELNVNSLFTSLVDSASISNFNTFKISPPDLLQSDVLYGLYQCRDDLSSTTCRDCVTNSISQLKTTCPMSTSGVIQLDGCFLKYDNTSFFGIEDKVEMFKTCGSSVDYNSNVLIRIDDALAHLIIDNRQYFRRGGSGSVQGVAQCRKDMNLDACEDCLLEARGRLRSECETSSWGDMYLGSCYIRYGSQNSNTYDYNDNDDDHRDRGKRKRKKKLRQVQRVAITVGATLGGTTSSVGLVITVTIIYKKRERERKASRHQPPVVQTKSTPSKTIIEPIKTPPPSPPHCPLPPPPPPCRLPPLQPIPPPPPGICLGYACPTPYGCGETVLVEDESFGSSWLSYLW